MRCLSPCIAPIAYLKRPHGDSQDDVDLDFYRVVLVVAGIEQLKRTSGHNAVTADRSGQGGLARKRVVTTVMWYIINLYCLEAPPTKWPRLGHKARARNLSSHEVSPCGFTAHIR